MSKAVQTKVVATVRDVARMVGLSPARFYELLKQGVFPLPNYDPQTGRPFYTEQQQAACLEVRQRNLGANGKPVLFYKSRRKVARHPVSRKPDAPPAPEVDRCSDILGAMKSLGLAKIKPEQVECAIDELFPDGFDEEDVGKVVREVFRRLKGQAAEHPVGSDERRQVDDDGDILVRV